MLARAVDAKDLPPLSLNADKGLIRKQDILNRATTTPTRFAHRALRSHVLLAACGAKEVAWEKEGRGAFTVAILKVLRDIGVENVTYNGLMGALPPIDL
jgi:hypothetical protein